jgi:heme A synthase
MITFSKFILPGILFLFTLASGMWLSKMGKPYNTGIFTIHKLIALGAVVLAAIQMAKGFKTTGVSSLVVFLLVVAILAVIALFVTGALMSLDKQPYALLLTIHQIAPAIMAVASVAVLFLLNTAI